MIKRAISLLLSLCIIMSVSCFFVVSAATGDNLALASNGATAVGFETNKDRPEINAIDGNKTSGVWQSYSSTSKSGRYLQVKLADIAMINEISFINTTSKNNWEIYYSLTGEEDSWTKATGLTVVSSSSPYEHKVTLSSVVAQYVKVVRTAACTNISIRELEVYGEFINPYLSGIEIDGEPLANFDKSVTSYDVEVLSSTDLPVITATAEDLSLPQESVVITQATPETMQATIEVIIGDYVHTYTINMLSLEGCAELNEITVGGKALDGFDRKTKEYEIYLHDDENIPEISATPLVNGAEVTDVVIDNEDMTAKIIVTSPDTTNVEEYVLSFVRTSDKLLSLSVDEGTLTPSFNEDVTEYTVFVSSLSSLPEISAQLKYDNAELTITNATSSSCRGLVSVTSKTGKTREYVVYFEKENPYEKLNVTATANGFVKGYPPENAVDGNYGTRWYYSKNNTVDGQLVLEMESLCVVGNVALYENCSKADANFENIEVSTDGLTWTKPEKTLTKYSNRKLGTLSDLGRKRVYDFLEPVVAKYVRFTWPTKEVGNHVLIGEMEVYGKTINPYLSSISVGNEMLLGFDKNINSYDVMVALENNLPLVSATAEDISLPAENIVITQATPETMQARINVISSGGEYTNTYIINMIAESKNIQLSSLDISEGTLSPLFDRDIMNYSVYVEDVTALPTVTATALSSNADVRITQANAENLTASVMVVSQDGSDSRIYTVEFIPTGYLLKSLSVNGYELNRSFDPDFRSYRIEMENLDEFPEVTGEVMYDNSTISITQATSGTKQAKITVTSKLGNSKTYNISFVKAINEENLSLTATAKSNKTYSDLGADKAIDGDMITRWHSANGNTDESPKAYIEIELSDPADIKNMVIWEIYSKSDAWYENIEYSLNGEDWTPVNATAFVYGDLQIEGSSQVGRERVYTVPEGIQARYIRLVAPKGGHVHMNEFEIYGTRRTDSYLKSVEFSCGRLGKAFDKKENIYNVFVDSKDELPEISAIPETDGASVEIIDATVDSMQATVKVTDPEGKFTNIYTFNMIERFTNTQLSILQTDVGELLPQFSKDVTEYIVYVEPDKKLPVVSATALSPDATVNLSQATAEDTTAVVTVTSGDGEISTQYEVEFITSGTDLDSLTAGTKEFFPVFDSQTYVYTVVLEAGEPLPEVSATAKYTVKEKIITQPTEDNLKATVVVESYFNLKSTYTINFLRKKNDSSSAKLTYIKLSEGCINGLFDPDKKEYTAYVSDRQNLPDIYPVTEDDGATYSVTAADANTMTAKINVTSGDGMQTEEYTLYFLVNAALGKSAWASNAYSGTKAPKAVDGKFDTYWNASNRDTPAWIVCNLEGTSKIFEVVVQTRFSESSSYYDIIQASNDGRNWTTIPSTCITESFPGKYGYPQFYKFTISFEPFDAKYVRVTGESSGRVTILELELWGIPEQTVSANSFLKELEFSSGKLSPSFNPYVTNYTISLGKNDEIPTITKAEAVDEFSTVTVTDATESTMQALIKVVAENGISNTVYSVTMDKEVDPEKNTYLSSLSLSHGEIFPAFSPKNSTYDVYLIPGTEIPEIKASAEITGASVSVNKTSDRAQISVTSKDTTSFRVYTLNFVYVNAELSELIIPGAELKPALKSGMYEYTAFLAPGAVIPDISATAENATVTITQANEKNKKAIIKVLANGANYSKTYTINFAFRQSLEEAVSAAMDCVKKLNVANNTTAEDIINAVKNVITNNDISISHNISFEKEKATSKSSGLITAIIKLTLGTESTEVKIRKVIPALSDDNKTLSGGGGGGGGGGGNVSMGTPSISNEAILNAQSSKKESNNMYEEISGHWAEKEVLALNKKGIVKGNGNSFALEDTVTRAEFITMLIRACNLEVIPYGNAFNDVKENDWFAQYVETARVSGIASGYDNKFNPLGTTSREEAVKMIVSAYEMLLGEIHNAEETDIVFTDSDEISQWSEVYIKKASAKNLVNGFETGEFRPKDTLTRAQAMTIIYRLIEADENAEEKR